MTENETDPHSKSGNVTAYLRRVLTIDSKQFDRLFAAIQFLFFGVLLATTPQYGPDSRLFPLVIGIPSFLLFGVLLLTQFSPRFAEIAGMFATSDMFAFDEQFGDETETNSTQEDDTLLDRRKRLVRISLWMLALFGLILLGGFYSGSIGSMPSVGGVDRSATRLFLLCSSFSYST
jgi:hypothetical protein